MTNLLLLLFALPIATIIIASILETILNKPIAVALLFFAIYLIVAFAAFDASFLIFVIIYTILAFISAVVTRAILNLIDNSNDDDDNDSCSCNCNNNNSSDDSSSCGCNRNSRFCNRFYR